MIIALAGRRVDAVGAKVPRFPVGNVELVRTRLRAMLETQRAKALVCSAACGADLIALAEAGAMGLRRRVVLPFDRRRFRETSVIDRPGDWGPVYDQVLNEVESAGELRFLDKAPDKGVYLAANAAILDEAVSLAEQLRDSVGAVLVWDGQSRGDHDSTKEFGAEARKRGIAILEVSTL